MSRIAQLANFVGPRSGGLRTTLQHLAAGYADAGHEVLRIVPGAADARTVQRWGREIVLGSPEIRGTGYRLLLRLGTVARELETWQPDRIEVHDRATLRRLGRWASARGIPSVVVSHERLDRVTRQWLPGGQVWDRAADWSNAGLAGSFDRVVCTTGWAAEEFRRLGAGNLAHVPLGVDLVTFDPARFSTSERARLARPDEVLLLMCSRLSREKQPWLAVEAVRTLVDRGVPVRLVVLGHGPLRRELQERAFGLPVRFLGFVSDRERVADLLATADVLLAPGPVETFGLAALESLASGTPVVARAESALPEVLGEAGRAVVGTPVAMADAVQSLLAVPVADRISAARARAELYPWSTTVHGFLSTHRLPGRRRVRA